MATGYTIYIENGEITNGKDFLLFTLAQRSIGSAGVVDIRPTWTNTKV